MTNITFDYKYTWVGTSYCWFKSSERQVCEGDARFIRGVMFFATYTCGKLVHWAPVNDSPYAANSFRSRL